MERNFLAFFPMHFCGLVREGAVFVKLRLAGGTGGLNLWWHALRAFSLMGYEYGLAAVVLVFMQCTVCIVPPTVPGVNCGGGTLCVRFFYGCGVCWGVS